MGEKINALALKAEIYQKIKASTKPHGAVLVIKNKIIEGNFIGLDYRKMWKGPGIRALNSIEFKDCIFLNFAQFVFSHSRQTENAQLKLTNCRFEKSLYLCSPGCRVDLSWVTVKTWVNFTRFSELSLDNLRAERIEFGTSSKKTWISIGRFSCNSIVYAQWYNKGETENMIISACHVSVFDFVRKFFPLNVIANVYADKNENLF